MPLTPTVDGEQYGGGSVSNLVASSTNILATIRRSDGRQIETSTKVYD